MARSYGRFVASPIGSGLAVLNGGLLLTTTAVGMALNRSARSDVGKSAGVSRVEFAFWGEAALQAVVGVVQPAASLSTFVGGDAAGLGWRLDTGQVFSGNGVLASGLPLISKGDIVGVRIDLAANTLKLFKNGVEVHSRSLPITGVTWHFATSIACATPGELQCAVNAGQWQSSVPAERWQATNPGAIALRLSDVDFLSTPADAPANTRWEGVIDASGFETYESMSFWPWGDAADSAGIARARIYDGDGTLNGLVGQDVRGAIVDVRIADSDVGLASVAPVARYALDSVDVDGSNFKQLVMRNVHTDLDEPLNRGVFLGNARQLAWRPQPIVIGAVSNVPAVAANSDGSVLWVADTPLAAVTSVRDRGDLMEAGTWTQTPDKQQLSMQNPPLGPVTVDASTIGAVGGSPTPATLRQFIGECFGRVQKADWSGASVDAIDAATGYAGIGYFNDELTPVSTAVDLALDSYGACTWSDEAGVLQFARVVAPTAGAVAADLYGEDLTQECFRTPDRAPRLSRRMLFRPNGFVYGAGDLVTDLVDVPVELRVRLTSNAWGQVFSGAKLPAMYGHADHADPQFSLFYNEVDAQAEIDRICTLYSVERAMWQWSERRADLNVRVGQVVRAWHPPAGLNGQPVLVRARRRNHITGDTTLVLWG